jgi:hypothetical protein
LSVVGKTLTIELVFEMLKSQSVVEDVDWRVGSAKSATYGDEISLPSVMAARLTTGMAETKDAAARAAMESEYFIVMDYGGFGRWIEKLSMRLKSDSNDRRERLLKVI